VLVLGATVDDVVGGGVAEVVVVEEAFLSARSFFNASIMGLKDVIRWKLMEGPDRDPIENVT
jgi:hypothetical protein